MTHPVHPAVAAERRRWDLPRPDPCPCGRDHPELYSDRACQAAWRRYRVVRDAAIDTSRIQEALEAGADFERALERVNAIIRTRTPGQIVADMAARIRELGIWPGGDE